jgi:hypothetical protein
MAIIGGIPQFQIHPILVPGMRHERHIDSLGEWSAHGEKKNHTSHVRQKQMRFSFHESVGVYPMINHAMKTIWSKCEPSSHFFENRGMNSQALMV